MQNSSLDFAQNAIINCLWSTSRVTIGVLIAIFLGISLGLLRSNLPIKIKRNKLVKFVFEAPTCPPPIAWIPFVILVFGISETSAYAIVFIGAIAPILTSTYEGIESIPQITRNVARSLEITNWKLQLQILIPAALPQIFTGIRTGITVGWMAVIAAEMIAGQAGLGYSIQLNRINMQYDLMLVDMIMIGTIGFFLKQLALKLQRIAMPYQKQSNL